MKKIMILGAGDNQLPLLKAAKKEMYFIVLCDRSDSPQWKEYADIFYQVDTINKDQILQIARFEKIDGIISNSEPAMLTVAYVSEKLGIPGNKYESISTLVSKDKFRTFQEKIGLFAPKHYSSEDFVAFNSRAKEMNYPVIIKPVESSGSRGTTILKKYEYEDVKKAFEINIKFSRNKQCSIEEYVDMMSLQVIDGDVFVNGTEILWEGMFTSIRSVKSPLIPMVQVYPIIIKKDELDIVKNTLKVIFTELGIIHGEFNVEMFFDNNGRLFVIEINARQGGNGIPSGIQKHSGIDMYKLLVTTSVGDNTYFDSVLNETHRCKYVSRYPVFSDNEGFYDGLNIDSTVGKYVDCVNDEIPFGSYVHRRENAESVICFVDLVFNSQEKQIEISSNIEELIYPIVKKEASDGNRQ